MARRVSGMGFDHLFFQGYAASTAPARPRRSLKSPRAREEPALSASDGLVAALLERANLCANAYLAKPLVRRIPACLRFLGVATTDEAERRLAENPELARAALDVALLGVSSFFRDAAVFEQIADCVLPSLGAQEPKLRIWSAGCAGGQELYSVAMLLARMGRLHDCELIGTDCRTGAIEQAKRGVFDPLGMGGHEPGWCREYFEPRSGDIQVAKRVRDAISWKCADVCSSVEPGPWHLILWRNMAIYLAQPVVRVIWQRLARELAPGGFIICGKAEQPPANAPLARVSSCIYQLALS